MATEGFTGMAALIRDIERMSGRAQEEAARIVQTTAELMAARVRQAYPSRTGTLRSRLVIERMDRGQFTRVDRVRALSGTLRWKVRSKAPHAHLYERGTVNRRTASTGANRGRMPRTPTFVPAAVQARARMQSELLALLKRQTVPGMDGTMEVRQS